MATDTRSKMSKAILMRLVDDAAEIQVSRDDIYLEWGWLSDDDESEPRFAGFQITAGLFARLKRDGLIALEDSDPDTGLQWWKSTGKAGAMLYPEKATFFGQRESAGG